LSNSIQITLLFKNNNLYFLPIGHRQERAIIKKAGSLPILDKDLYEAQDMAEKVTEALGGAGLLGVEFSC
jgi:phosphoribosylglycinamide formyltransferase 2